MREASYQQFIYMALVFGMAIMVSSWGDTPKAVPNDWRSVFK